MITKKPIARLSAQETRLGIGTKGKKTVKRKNVSEWKQKKFFFLKDAITFQRKKRKEGFKTRKNKINNASEYHIIYWSK